MSDLKYAPISLSESDELLKTWGYDLVEEYFSVAREASVDPGSSVLEVATGTGRMTAVLTRLGCNVTTGDVTQEKAEQLWRRVTPAYAPQVKVMLLDLEKLPFTTGSVRTVFCMNTLHELANPHRCLEELLRIHDRSGTVVVGDFNETGFTAMQNVHQSIYKNDHPRGLMKITAVESILREHYSDVRVVLTPLNISLIATGKK
jgi:ubiquinone/menaquinone biosynthesis C-methylase UbiE